MNRLRLLSFSADRLAAIRESDAQAALYRRLCWAHGDERARQIVAGQDQQANADLQAWRDLGHPL